MLSLVHEASVYRRLIATGADQALLLPGTAAPPDDGPHKTLHTASSD